VRLCLFGVGGKVGSVLGPALERAGHEVVDGREVGPGGCDVAIDFTRPEAVLGNAALALEARVPLVVGTTGFDTDELDRLARGAEVPCLYAPNFALGAVLMMRFAEEASRAMPRAEIVELHAETKLDAPSGTATATAARMGEGVTIPFIGMLGKHFPQAQFVITGVLGPHSNAHGPNEFLHIGYAKKLTACVADVLSAHAGR